MHDLNNLEGRGIPGVGVASTEFVEAAAAQTKSLGFEPAMIFVQHPIQDRTDEEIQVLADSAFAKIVGQISMDG
jgi:hypothetical protein